MSDLISKEVLIEELEKELEWSAEHPSNPSFKYGRMSGLRSAIRIAKDAKPTIDAVPVVKAEWKYYKKQGIAVCTNCSFERNVDDNLGKAVACPNCGCQMKG